MNIAKAPAGGMTSKVNGQRYEGGEFMPVTGLFCGKSGQKRQLKWDKAVSQKKAIYLGGSKMFEIAKFVSSGVWQIVGYVIADDHKQAEAAFFNGVKLYAKQV